VENLGYYEELRELYRLIGIDGVMKLRHVGQLGETNERRILLGNQSVVRLRIRRKILEWISENS
jgi:hypothetical protein